MNRRFTIGSVVIGCWAGWPPSPWATAAHIEHRLRCRFYGHSVQVR